MAVSGAEDRSENGMRGLGFDGEADEDGSEESMSCGLQRMPGRRTRSEALSFIVVVVVGVPVAVAV